MTSRFVASALTIAALLIAAAGCAKSADGGTPSQDSVTTTTARPAGDNARETKGVDLLKGLLDGRSFSMSYTENGATITDTISFTDGRFHSVGCDPYGFDRPTYTAAAEGDVISFHAEAVSSAEGKMHWTGRVIGKTLQGKYVWTKEGQNPSEMEFTAHEL